MITLQDSQAKILLNQPLKGFKKINKIIKNL